MGAHTFVYDIIHERIYVYQRTGSRSPRSILIKFKKEKSVDAVSLVTVGSQLQAFPICAIRDPSRISLSILVC
jgi:hypothetical protein